MPVSWRVVPIERRFRSEGSAIADVNSRDGRLDVIYRGGDIVTMDTRRPSVEALAVKKMKTPPGGIIVCWAPTSRGA